MGILRAVQDPVMCQSLVRRLKRTPYARREFERAFVPSSDPVIRAQRAITRAYPSALYDQRLLGWQRVT